MTQRSKWARSSLGWGAVAALAVLLIGLTIIFNYSLAGWQIDLTENHLYTLSPGTRHILAGIREPIDLDFFYSSEAAQAHPQLRAYATQVQDFLEEIAQRAHGKIRLHIIDPQPYSVAEDRAAALGVTGVPLSAAGSKFYFGLAGTNSTNGQQAIPFFDPAKQRFLEYRVAKLIYTLAHPDRPVIEWDSGLPMSGGYNPRTGQMRQPWLVYRQAAQLYHLRPLNPQATAISPSTRVLVLVDPRNLTPAARFAIDQYALRGGHIVAFVNPATQSAGPGSPRGGSQLSGLLTAWGVRFDPAKVIADRSLALTVSGAQGTPTEDPAFLGLDRDNMSQHDVITAGLSNVNLATTGYLSPVKGSKTKFEPLMWSSRDAEPVSAGKFALPTPPQSLLEGFSPTGKRYTLAARVTGMVKSAFPDGPPKGVALPSGSKDLKASVKPLHLVVFADADMLANYLWVRQMNLFGHQLNEAMAENGNLVLNVLDNLAGSADLISVRGKAGFTRPFTRVQALRRVAQARYHAEQQQLQQQLHRTEQQLTLLQSKKISKSTLILTPAQQQQIRHFEAERVSIRKRLRAVQAGLVHNINQLGTELKAINIIVIPGAFALAALLAAAWRKRRHSNSKTQ